MRYPTLTARIEVRPASMASDCFAGNRDTAVDEKRGAAEW